MVFDQWGSFEVSHRIGLQGRVDRLNPVSLYGTRQRDIWTTVREDRVTQRSVSLWLQNETRWATWFRSIQGLRADAYDFAVDANLNANSGNRSDQMLTPKLSLVFGPWRRSEIYLSYGHGFHSNDARGTTIRLDPSSGDALSPLKPLVRTRGHETGLRTEILPGW